MPLSSSAKQRGINHILARVKHPQTNGKIERWFGIYKQFREKVPTFEEFILWYNKIRPHQSLDDENGKMITPKEAFWKRAEGHIYHKKLQYVIGDTRKEKEETTGKKKGTKYFCGITYSVMFSRILCFPWEEIRSMTKVEL